MSHFFITPMWNKIITVKSCQEAGLEFMETKPEMSNS